MDTSRELVEHLEYLRRFARAHTREDELADEAVQETLLAAIESGQSFAGRARLRTWLTGILLHKIHDGFRRRAREATRREADVGEDWVDFLHARAQEATATSAGGPEHALHCRQLREAIGRAMATMPPRQKEAFLLKEVSALETHHIVELLGVSTANLWVLVHRARRHLQAALRQEGFSPA